MQHLKEYASQRVGYTVSRCIKRRIRGGYKWWEIIVNHHPLGTTGIHKRERATLVAET